MALRTGPRLGQRRASTQPGGGGSEADGDDDSDNDDDDDDKDSDSEGANDDGDLLGKPLGIPRMSGHQFTQPGETVVY